MMLQQNTLSSKIADILMCLIIFVIFDTDTTKHSTYTSSHTNMNEKQKSNNCKGLTDQKNRWVACAKNIDDIILTCTCFVAVASADRRRCWANLGNKRPKSSALPSAGCVPLRRQKLHHHCCRAVIHKGHTTNENTNKKRVEDQKKWSTSPTKTKPNVWERKTKIRLTFMFWTHVLIKQKIKIN